MMMVGKKKQAVITRGMIQDNPLKIVTEFQKYLLNPDKHEGKLTYPATVRHFFEIESSNNGILQLLKEKYESYFEYTAGPNKYIYYCYVEHEDGESGPHGHCQDPLVYRQKDPEKFADLTLQLSQFIIGSSLSSDTTIPVGSRVTVRFYSPLLSAYKDINGVSGEIIAIDYFNTAGEPPLGDSTAELFRELPPSSVPVREIDTLADEFDNLLSTAASTPTVVDINSDFPDIINPDNHALTGLNPDFLKIMKAFILKCWQEHQIQIQPINGYRTVKQSNDAREKWEQRKAVGEDMTSIPRPAWGGESFHNGALALDFVAIKYEEDREPVRLNKDVTREVWINSGIGNVIETLGLQWGINFPNNYDPIHVDMQRILGWNLKDLKRFLNKSEECGILPNKWPVYDYVDDSVNCPTSAPAETTLIGEDGTSELSPEDLNSLGTSRVSIDPE